MSFDSERRAIAARHQMHDRSVLASENYSFSVSKGLILHNITELLVVYVKQRPVERS